MAGFGYTYKSGYTTYNDLAPPRAGGWTKTSYASDHPEGRRKPIISYTPDGKGTECYVTKTEIVERVPLVIEYRQAAPIRFEVYREHSDVEDKRNNRLSSPEKWRRPTSPVRHHGVEKWHRPSSPEEWRRPTSPVSYHGEEKWNRPSSPEEWRRPTSPVGYHGEEKWNRHSSPVHDQPQKVDHFITKVQTEASGSPNKFGHQSATHWRQTPPGYGDHRQSDLSNKEGQKPNHGAWSTPQGGNLSSPTCDISTAMEYLKEASKPTSDMETVKKTDVPSSRYKTQAFMGNTLPVSARPNRDVYAKTINSREAARKYGGTTV